MFLKDRMERKVIKSAARVLHVLEFFDEVKRAVSVAEIAEHHDWPHSSTSALMASLVSLGYLHYDASKRTYLPSMRVALLGDWIQGNLLREGQLMRLMQHLNDETGETIVLASQNGLHSQYLRVIQGTNALRLHLHIGTLRPMFGSGTGSMLLSAMDDAAIRKLAKKHNASVESPKQLEIPKLIEEAAEDRARGYYLSLNQVTPHSGILAMLLPTAPEEKPLVLGISGLSVRLIENEQRYVEIMREGMKRFLGD
jgi:DNA-binding IclR family transcriptional regulator